MDNKLLKKLNYKEGENALIINAPDSYLENISSLNYDSRPSERYDFVQIFLRQKAEIPKYFELGTDHLNDHGKLWFCYAKKSSELYTDISRDEGWDVAEQHDFIAVRQVAIDNDWSALRFKPISDVKEINRKKEGDTSKENKELYLPPSVQKALNANPFCRHNFNNLSYTNQKEFINWISEAKKEETVKKRLDDMINKLKAGKKNPYDK